MNNGVGKRFTVVMAENPQDFTDFLRVITFFLEMNQLGNSTNNIGKEPLAGDQLLQRISKSN